MNPPRSHSSEERHEQAFFARQFIVAATGVVYWIMTSGTGTLLSPYVPIAIAVTLNVLYYVLAAKRRFYPQVKWIQIPVDMALWTWLIHLTGGPSSLFYPLYAFEIMLAAITLSAAGCAYAAILSVLFYSLVTHAWPGPFAFMAILPRLALFAGTGAVCAVLVMRLAAKERTVRDLNEKLRHRVKITTAEQDAVLDGMAGGLVGVGADGAVTMFNRRAEEITGFRASQVLGKACTEILGTESPICGRIMDGLEGTSSPMEAEADVNFGGRAKRLSLSCFGLPEGFPTRSVCIFQDRTEVRDLERRTIRAETLSGLGAMAATLAHELRTPLTAIAGFAAMLRERLAGSPKEAEIAGKIERGVGNLETITGQLLGFTGTPELSKTDTPLAAVVDSALEMMPENGRNSMSLSLDDDCGGLNLYCDPLQLRQAILNLVRNAAEAAGDGGEVKVSLRRDGDEAQIEVADSGPGVPEELSTRIFLPFFTTKKGGTGLGLAYSEKMVRAHGGQITLESAYGTNAGGGTGAKSEGARFTIRLPLPDAALVGKLARAAASTDGPDRERAVEAPSKEDTIAVGTMGDTT
jgi:PAS domain S-box-containing protein